MAKAKVPTPAATAAVSAVLAAAASSQGAAEVGGKSDITNETQATGKTELNPSIPTDKQLKAKEKADAKAAAAEAIAQKAKDKADAAAAKKEAADKAKSDKAEARAAAKKEREERLAALIASGQAPGPMLALADKVKSGVYVKGANGQLHSTDQLATALDGVNPTDVINLSLDLLGLEENPYHALNTGQQSMNLRNRLRGAIKKGTVKIEAIAEYIARNKIHVVTKADAEAKAKEKAEKKAAADKAKEDAKKAKAGDAATKAGETTKEATGAE